MLRRLHEWGVERIYGYPGDGSRTPSRPSIRSTGLSSFRSATRISPLRATAHAKYTGEVGVCMAPPVPCAIHLPQRPLRRQADHAPWSAIVGQQSRTSLGAAYPYEVDCRLST